MDIILLDTETTGVEPNARLVQLAYKNLSTGKSVNEYFKPPIPISINAMATHHITNREVEDKPAFIGSECQKEINRLLPKNILVAHNALYDMTILRNEDVAIGKYIDTLRLSKHLIESEAYNMQYLRYFLDLNVTALAHNAMGDVAVLEALFNHLKELVKKKLNVSSDEDIYTAMLDLTQQPVLLKTLMFGKYKGKTFADVLEYDRNYLQWLYDEQMKNDEIDRNEDLVYTLKEYLQVR
ncbi:MAG: exonuclease domain-containing protein [Candidatus Komeilibacteria bacterium]